MDQWVSPASGGGVQISRVLVYEWGEGAAQDWQEIEEAKPKGEPLDLMVDLRSHPQRWSWGLGKDLGGTWSRATAPLHQGKSAEVDWE